MRLWTLAIRPQAQRDIRNLDKRIAEQVLEKLEWLERNFDAVIPLRLSGNCSEFYKLRVGD